MDEDLRVVAAGEEVGHVGGEEEVGDGSRVGSEVCDLRQKKGQHGASKILGE